MQSTELRIGNYIQSAFNQIETVRMIMGHEGYKDRKDVHEIYKHLIGVEENGNQYNLAEIKPIPLTKEWLLKFGFEKTYAENSYKISLGEFVQHQLYITILGRYNIVTLGDNYGEKEVLMVFTSRISEYVHQLQNLYFALTETELIHKP